MRHLLLSLITLWLVAGPAWADDPRTLPPGAVRVAAELSAAADAENVPAFVALFAVKERGHGRAWAEEEIRSAKSIAHAFGLRRGNWISTRRGDAVVVNRDDPSARELAMFELAETDGTWAVRDVYFTTGTTPAPSAPEVTSGLDDSRVVGGLLGAGVSSSPSSGVSYGRTGMRRVPLPEVKLGTGTVKGGLDAAIVRRYLKRNMAKVTYCYEKVLAEKRNPRGTMTVKFTIQADGIVASAKASGVRRDVDDCVRDVVAAIEFPRRKEGEVVVRYPISFRVTRR